MSIVDRTRESHSESAPPTESQQALPTGPKVDETLSPIGKKHEIRETIQLVTLCWTLFVAGWNDGSVGPLIPRIQQVYHIGYTVLSLVFVFQCVGCLAGAFINIHFDEKYGLGKLLLLGSFMQLVAYTLQAAALPFPVFVLAAVFNGAGLAIQDAQANGYVASLKTNSETKMGYVQAAYGAGALVSPLVATQFAQLRHWSFHYLTSLGVAVLNIIFLSVVFRAKTQDECLAQIGQEAGEKGESEKSHFRQILSIKAVHLLALFLLVYVGVEVTIGGWIVSFMITVRGGGPSAGYISAGFFGGLTLGRVVLLPLNKKIGERRVVYLYTLIAIALELVIWLVPSLVGGAISVSLVGLVLGPMYPIAMNHAGRVFPRWLLTGSIGWITAIATTGAAVIPFVTGAIASKAGIQSLEPVVVAMLAAMLVLWTVVPAHKI
ncbi:major facilitator superfamily domain-containing protein [Mycena albidolilacea]|uniref:Major facilitator superfamily domain-containing protein n=1 Tax=Mycena albidolilacea TaxID=1033008 RepID=A0AAD7A726_9AGAR|nr:major facilitator superfamily domain-containing protein [Mycena albidolilacea]